MTESPTDPTDARPVRDDGARSERTLSDGTVVAVEVRGRADADTVAERGLQGAGAAILGEAGGAKESSPSATPRLVGDSPAMRELFRLLERIRGSNATVLITGENGTGKELVARTIHEGSPRAGRRFVATNCSAFNDNLLESELFGHKRGAFTGAVHDKPGLFEVADKGTFLLDEVADMSPALQVKLLRVLQEGVFMPVGGTEQRKVDVRIIAATNGDLSQRVTEGSFREDLYYRLNVVHLRVPPLRERREDIPKLVQHFLDGLAERDGRRKDLTQRALDRLVHYDWPGNVRELENEIERLWVLSGDQSVVDEEFLSANVGRSGGTPPATSAASSSPAREPSAAPTAATLPEAVENLERQMIVDGLERAGGNKTRAAELLGISRRNLIRKVQTYGLES